MIDKNQINYKMASRNRTLEFNKIRENELKKKIQIIDSESDSKFLLENKINKSDNFTLVNTNNINEFDNEIKMLRIKTEKKIVELKILQNKRLMVDFITDERSQELLIDQNVIIITNNIKLIQKLILDVSKINDNTLDSQLKKNFIDAQSINLQNLITNFKLCQKIYKDKIEGQQKICSNNSFWENFSNESHNSFQNCKTDHKLETMTNDYETMIDQRDNEIIKIAKSIEELSGLFNELNNLVHKQGTILDRIDYNMECAVDNVKSGGEQLVKANNYQKSSSSTTQKIIIGLTGMIGIVLGVFVIKETQNF